MRTLHQVPGDVRHLFPTVFAVWSGSESGGGRTWQIVFVARLLSTADAFISHGAIILVWFVRLLWCAASLSVQSEIAGFALLRFERRQIDELPGPDMTRHLVDCLELSMSIVEIVCFQ